MSGRMIKSWPLALLLAALAVPAAYGQFDLFVVDGNGEHPVPATYDLGSLFAGESVSAHFRLRNTSNAPATVTVLQVAGFGFTLNAPPPPPPLALASQAAVDFTVAFSAADAGAYSAALRSDGVSVLLTVTVLQRLTPLPKPTLAIDLQQAASLQQGTLTVRFDSPAITAGSGTLTLAFVAAAAGATDPAIVFASGGRTATFAVSPGDTQAAILFQTGTTAGVITFAVQLGGATDQLAVTIPAAPVGITAAQGLRSTASVEVRVTGFDNTRTLSQLTFTFYDAAGNALAPAIATDATRDFAQYFQTSDAGGVFLLRAVFPITGAASAIASFEAGLTNSAATAKTARTVF